MSGIIKRARGGEFSGQSPVDMAFLIALGGFRILGALSEGISHISRKNHSTPNFTAPNALGHLASTAELPNGNGVGANYASPQQTIEGVK